MRNFLIILAMFFYQICSIWAVEMPQISVFDQIPEASKKVLEKNEIYAQSKVESGKDWQSLDFVIVGQTSNSCRDGLRKMSRYETYPQYVGFIKKATYNDSNERVRFEMSSNLLPFDMVLAFKLPRIKSAGSYPFSFDNGFLKDLKGVIQVEERLNRCLFYTTAEWKGPHTGIPDSVLSFFSQALSKISMENMFRIAK